MELKIVGVKDTLALVYIDLCKNLRINYEEYFDDM